MLQLLLQLCVSLVSTARRNPQVRNKFLVPREHIFPSMVVRVFPIAQFALRVVIALKAQRTLLFARKDFIAQLELAILYHACLELMAILLALYPVMNV